MKKIKLFMAFIFTVILATGCVINFQDSVTGDGNVVKQARDLPEFTGLKVSAGIEVFISQGESQQVEVEADENLQEWIMTEVNGSVLHIYTDKMIRLAKTKKVYITCKSLDEIDISSAAEVTGITPFKSDKLDIEQSSDGDLRLEVEASEIEISLSSAADAELKGKTSMLKADMSSAGGLDAANLEAKSVDVSVSSAGKARVFVTEEASFRASSGGNITYEGEPKIREINTSSGGSVNKR